MSERLRVTKDDERARRICSLALEFMNARAPIRSSAVARGFYPELSADSFRRSFSRDRDVLAACGVLVVERGRAGGELTWGIDEHGSYAEGVELGAREAAALELACQGLLSDPAFPLVEDLRLALAKVTRAFAEVPAQAVGPGRGGSRALSALGTAIVERRGVLATYTDARGTSSRRTLAPYGLFGLRGAVYLVAETLCDRRASGEIRTYRLDRFEDARVLEDVSCKVPDDFSVLDWRRLPFQLGDDPQQVAFEVPRDREAAIRDEAAGQGAFEREGDALVWSVSACDLEAAASWAVSQGIRPRSPERLVRTWERVLEGALGDDA